MIRVNKKRELKILMTGENDAIDHVIFYCVTKMYPRLKIFSKGGKYPNQKQKLRLGTLLDCC